MEALNQARTTVIPRCVEDSKLKFYVLFNFDIGNETEASKWKFLHNWPARIKDVIPLMTVEIAGHEASLAIEQFPEASRLEKKYVKGLGYQKSDRDIAEAAWAAIFHTRLSSPKAQDVPHYPGRLRSLILDHKQFEDVRPNPIAASDLRPTHRIEIPQRGSLKEASRLMQDLAHLRQSAHDPTAVAVTDALKRATRESNRINRMIETSRNKSGGGMDVPIGKQMQSKTWDGADVPLNQLFGRVAQYPGLLRRLKLAIYCSIPMPRDLPPIGIIRIKEFQLEDVEFHGNSTQFEFSSGLGFKSKDGTNQPEFLRSQSLVNPADYEVSQHDYTAWIASSNAAPDNRQSADAPRPSDFVGIYHVDKAVSLQKEEGFVTNAHTLHARLLQAGKHSARLQQLAELKARIKQLRNQPDTLSPLDKSKATADLEERQAALATLQQQIQQDSFRAENLSRGITVDVRKDDAKWASLCMREVTLKTLTGKKPGTLLTWIEEASVPLSAAETPPPAVGELVKPEKAGSIRVMVFGTPSADNKLRYASGVGRDFLLRGSMDGDPTRITSLVGRRTTAENLLPGNIVQITAGISQGSLTAQEIVFYPVLDADLGALDPTKKESEFFTISAEQQFADSKHRFPILIHNIAVTSFLDAAGSVLLAERLLETIKLGLREGFTVEGARRFVATQVPPQNVEPRESFTANKGEKIFAVFADSLPAARLSIEHVASVGDRNRLIPLGNGRVVRIESTCPLEMIRGFVESVFMEFGGKFENKKVAEVEFDPKKELPTAPPADKLRIVRGIAKYEQGKWMAQSWIESKDLDQKSKADWSDEDRAQAEQTQRSWRITVQDLSGLTRTVAIPSYDTSAKPPFLKPEDCARSTLVECFVIRQGKRFVVRHLPQLVFGTLRNTDNPQLKLLCLPDGSFVSSTSSMQGLPITGFFTLQKDDKGNIVVKETKSNDVTLAPFKIAGEVINITTPPANDFIIDIRAMGGAKTWSVRAGSNFTLSESADPNFQRRIADLEPGDFVALDTEILGDGYLGAIASRSNIAAFMAGGVWHSSNTRSLLSEGHSNLIPIELTTEARNKRIVWVPPAERTINGEWMIFGMPVVDAKVITFLKRVNGIDQEQNRLPPNPSELKNAVGLEPVTVSLSDAISRWGGWSLVVPEPGEADKIDEKKPAASPRNDPFSIEIAVPKNVKLPKLRYGSSYAFRLRHADLAGNHGLDEPIAETFSERHESSVKLNRYERPEIAPSRPVIALLGSNDQISVPFEDDKSSKGAVATPRLLYVSDPVVDPSGESGVAVDPGQLWILPPVCPITTIIKSGRLDQFPNPESLFAQHEKHFDDGTFTFKNGKLNYFPDPLVYLTAEGGQAHEIALADENGHSFQSMDEQLQVASINISGAKEWPGCLPLRVQYMPGITPVAKIDGRTVRLALPPSWTGRGLVRSVQSKSVWTDFQIIHATRTPRFRPEWTSLENDMTRAVNETVDRFQGIIRLHPRSTGAIGIASYWNEYWDETSPLHFVEAKVSCRVKNGGVEKAYVKNPGAGYGTTARFVCMLPDGIRAKNNFNLPLFEARFTDGKLTDVQVVFNGSGIEADFDLRVLRRPPLVAFATGAVVLGKHGGISSVRILEPGGFYSLPPHVIFHDMTGNGRGAVAVAKLNETGGVEEVSITEQGMGYSEGTIASFYTHSKAIPEIPVKTPEPPDEQEQLAQRNGQTYLVEADIHFDQVFGDTKARETFYVASGISRFRELLKQVTPGFENQGIDAANSLQPAHSKTSELNPSLIPIVRDSTPHRIEVRATSRPPQPEWHHHSYSYRWSANPSNGYPFRMNPEDNELVIRREGSIRCYLRRGWNTTGREQLGIVVMHCERNTTSLQNTTGSIVPAGMRELVSRWGYDPVWDDIPVPPLTLDDLTSQSGFVPYEDLFEYTGADKRLVGIALHEVHYDSDKELYYADISIRTSESLPFVQLALVRYQPMAIDGLTLSKVVLADPIRVPGDRDLRIQRHSGRFGPYNATLAGPFQTSNAQTIPGQNDSIKASSMLLPRREITVELRRRLAGYAHEIEGPLANEFTGKKNLYDGSVMQDRFSSPDVFQLQYSEKDRRFSADFKINSLKGKDDQFYLKIVERELYATSEPQRDDTGDRSRMLPSARAKDFSTKLSTADLIPFACTIDF